MVPLSTSSHGLSRREFLVGSVNSGLVLAGIKLVGEKPSEPEGDGFGWTGFIGESGKIRIMISPAEDLRVEREQIEFADRYIRGSGLLRDMEAFYVLPSTDPIFYPYYPVFSERPGFNSAGRTWRGENGVCVAVKNQIIGDLVVPHELGHCVHPALNSRVRLDMNKTLHQEYLDEYFQRFAGYFNRLPEYFSDIYMSIIEWEYVSMYKYYVGETYWRGFTDLIPEQIMDGWRELYGVTEYYFPDEHIETYISSLGKDSLPKKALIWRKERLESLDSSQRLGLLDNGFTYSSLGSYLLHGNYLVHGLGNIRERNYLPTEKTVGALAAQCFDSTEGEMFADLWSERLLFGVTPALDSSPKTVRFMSEVQSVVKSEG